MPVVFYISPECPIEIISLTFTDPEWYRTTRQHRRHRIYDNPPLRAPLDENHATAHVWLQITTVSPKASSRLDALTLPFRKMD
jgi:hypothetical protein